MTIREQIEHSAIFQSGQRFRPLDMSRHLGIKSSEICNTLVGMRSGGHVGYDGICYWRPQQHWINKMRLANPVKGVNA